MGPVSDDLLPHPATGKTFPSPVPPGTGWPGDPATQQTTVARTPTQVRRLAGGVNLDELDARISVCRACPRLVRWREDVARLSRTDLLTGMYNRRHLEQELARLHNESTRHSAPLCVLLLDLDRFKRVNDTYGHGAGDDVLREFARRVTDELRAGDIGGRWGGEEFVVIMPRTDLGAARALAERIRSVAAAEPVISGGDSIDITVSGGCALGPSDSPATVVRAAEDFLYRAKEEGRNRIVFGPQG
jgi:two-component system cell cycle response regulator